MKTLTELIKSIREDMNLREMKKRMRRRSRLDSQAEGAIGVREYKRELWFSYKDIPLVRVKEIGGGDEFRLYSALDDARDNYRNIVLEGETDY